MSDIPLARLLLSDLADDLRLQNPSAAQIIDMVVSDLMYRTHVKPRAPISSARMTSTLARSIRIMAAHRPDMSAQEIADIFNVNSGRVSEAIAGKW
jgi:hypothetical protein